MLEETHQGISWILGKYLIPIKYDAKSDKWSIRPREDWNYELEVQQWLFQSWQPHWLGL